MYSFEGQFCRRPEQNLAGASVKCPRDELLRNAHEARQKRETDRKKEYYTIFIQARARGFLTRQSWKRMRRGHFDYLDSQYPVLVNKNDPPISNTKLITEMASHLLYFYKENEDELRLINFMHRIIMSKEQLILLLLNERPWRWKVKRLLVLCLNELVRSKNVISVCLRSLDVFLTEDIYLSIVSEQQQQLFISALLDMYVHVLQNGYYHQMRLLLDKTTPPLFTVGPLPPTLLCDSIVKFLVRPMNLMNKTNDKGFRNLVIGRFLDTFLFAPYTEPIKKFLIPFLKSNSSLSFEEVIQYILEKKLYNKHDDASTWILGSLLSLESLEFLNSCDDITLRRYLKILSIHSKQIIRLESYYRKLKNSTTDSDDDDIDEDEPPEELITTLEIEVLTDAIACSNDNERLECIINRFKNCKSERVRFSMIQSLATFSYYLIAAKPCTFTDFKMITYLSTVPSFIYEHWIVVVHMEKPSVFGNPTRYHNLVRQAVELDAEDIYKFVPVITSFCYFFIFIIYTMDDIEVFGDEHGNGRHELMPFRPKDIVSLCSVVKEICIGLVEISFPEKKGLLTLDKSTVYSNPIIKSMTERFFDSVVGFLRSLYIRDLRRPFAPEGFWCSSRFQISKMNVPFADIDSIITRKIPVKPFSGPLSYSKKDLEEGPPLTCNQLRTSLIMREVPFFVSFADRVLILQKCISKDKLIYQGEVPYFNRHGVIPVTIRRNFIYEDAFDRLAKIDGKMLRRVLRIQLKSPIGTDEPGIDGGGLFKEFMSELLKTAFDPNRGFFCLTEDNYLYPNPHAKLVHNYNVAEHYYFIGRMVGKALYENLLIELPLASFFLSKITFRNSDLGFNYLSSLDPMVYKSLLYLKNYKGDVADLNLDFTVVVDILGQTQTVELEKGGSKIPVTASNKMRYIQLLADYKLNKQIKEQYIEFKKGLMDIIRPEWLHMFSNKELQTLISGSEMPIDLDDMKNNTKYSGGFDAEHETIKFFWRAMEEFNDVTRRLLLKFVTSCSRPPLFGFKDLDPPLCIQNVNNPNRLPTASTCMNLLKLPAYDKYETLRERILYAIRSGSGFELS